MIIVRESNKMHWVIGKRAECARCETIVEFDTLEDIVPIAYNDDKVKYTCPRCKYYQEFRKSPIKNKFAGIANEIDMSI